MPKRAGDQVRHPRTGRTGVVVDVYTNPACLMRTLVIRWDDGELEEVDELEFGPLDDE